MAEYYPLLSRAVAGLRDSAPEARQAIYGRARQALIGQLRGMQPPVPEEAITKEITALDNAIARIETEMAPPPSISDAASAAVEAALLFEAAPEPSSPSAPSAEITAAREATPSEASRVTVKPPASRPAPPLIRPDRPALTPRSSLPGGGRLQRQEPPRLDPIDPVPSSGEPAPAKPEPVTPTADPVLPVAPTLETVLVKRDEGPNAEPTLSVDKVGEPTLDTAMAAEARTRDEIMRPAMPRQTVPQARNLRVWIVAVAALAAVVVIALTAWKLRDNPQELVRAPPPATQTEGAAGKIVERADSPASNGDDTADASVQSSGGSQTQTGAASAPQAATPVPAPSAGTAVQPASDQTVPVSYKAAVLVAAPDTPEKVKTYVGSVVWRLEGATGQGASATSAVRADVDVPEAKLQMTMEIRKNTEAQFPASHTIDIKFTPGPDSPVGAVKQIDVPQMRREDAETGEPLMGVPVTITNNSFLVGLTRGDAEARNVEAMRSRGWFDIPMVLADGKPAKITFEKGASGDRILAEALAAWSKN